MFSKEELWKIRSNWIHPDGTIQVVEQEGHDDDLPPFCRTIENAERLCVKVSCCWGYDAPISNIFLPDKITSYQAQKLVEINESLVQHEGKSIKNKIEKFGSHNWNDVLDSI